MYSLRKFHSRSGRLGKPLPSPYPTFELNAIKFRYATTSMIAGKPGAMKSTLALNLLHFWALDGLTGIYFSADSDENTVARRIAGMTTGRSAEQVEQDFINGQFGRYEEGFRVFDKIRFQYRDMDMEGIADQLELYATVHGDYPEVVFLDNLINFVETSDDWAAMRDMTKELDVLARETGSHICVLHHASESWGQASDPVPRAAIQGKITQIPVLALTVAVDGPIQKVCCVKNRNGPDYPDANRWMDFRIEPNLQITDNYREHL